MTAANAGLGVIGFANPELGVRFLLSVLAAADLVAMVVLLTSRKQACEKAPWLTDHT